MLNFLRAKVAAVIAITTMVWPAFAQFDPNSIFDPNTITAPFSRPYAGYYAPYGMLAEAPYYKGHLAKGDNGQAVVNWMFTRENFDVDYVIAQSKSEGHPVTLPDIVNGAMAPDALGPWRYEFGGNAKDVCYDGKSDSYCWAHRPHWWQYHYPGPTFQVWSKEDTSHESGRAQSNVESCSEVSIGFRGTVPGSSDEISNARVIAGVEKIYDTSYTWLRRNIDAIINHVVKLECYEHAKSPIIVSLGHSLGAGLAQLAALANNPNRPDKVRIDKVFAFEPSPDTGGDLVEDGIRKANINGLEIDRVGQVEDVSAYLQSARQYLPTLVRDIPAGRFFIREGPNEFFPEEVKGNTCVPALRHVRFDERRNPNPVEQHEWITTVAQFIYIRKVQKEEQGEAPQIVEPPDIRECGEATPTRYEKWKLNQKELIAHALPPSAVVAPQQAQQSTLGAQQQLYAVASRQSIGLNYGQALPPSDYVLASNLGARATGKARPQPQLAVLDQRQAQVVSADARFTRVTALGARGQFYALAQTQYVDLDHRQARFASTYVLAANLGARRASSAPTQSQLSDRDARPVLISTAPSWR
jgi:hypothetical protein